MFWAILCCYGIKERTLKVEYLREFATLAEEASFTKAAKKLFITQPALSKHVATLEKEIGINLVNHSTRKTVITPAGMVAAERFADIIERYDAALAAIVLQDGGYSRTYRLGFLLQSLDSAMYSATEEMKSMSPSCKVTASFEDANALIRGLLEDVYDIVLVMNVSFPNDGLMKFRLVKRESLCVMLPEEDPLSRFADLSIHQIKDRTLVFPQDEGGYADFIVELFGKQGLPEPRIVYSSQKSTQLFTMRSTDGISIVTRESQKNLPRDAKLVTLSDPPSTVDLCWVYKSALDSPETTLFLNEIQDVLVRAHAV